MAFLEWKPCYSVQVDELDRQHQRLIQLINSLHDAMKVGAPKPAMQRITGDLVMYTRFHFRSEEHLMRLHGYPGMEEHLFEHERLAGTVARFEEDLRAGKVAMSVSLMQFLKDWLTGHIMGADMKYAPYMSDCAAAGFLPAGTPIGIGSR